MDPMYVRGGNRANFTFKLKCLLLFLEWLAAVTRQSDNVCTVSS